MLSRRRFARRDFDTLVVLRFSVVRCCNVHASNHRFRQQSKEDQERVATLTASGTCPCDMLQTLDIASSYTKRLTRACVLLFCPHSSRCHPHRPVAGKALTFTSAMAALLKKFPAQDNGVAFIFQGCYYLAAPWPIRSTKKALTCFEKAIEVSKLHTAAVGSRTSQPLFSSCPVWFLSPFCLCSRPRHSCWRCTCSRVLWDDAPSPE